MKPYFDASGKYRDIKPSEKHDEYRAAIRRLRRYELREKAGIVVELIAWIAGILAAIYIIAIVIPEQYLQP